MEKTATLNLRVNPVVKQRAEEVLAKLGVPMSTAIDMYLNQIGLTGGIPFMIKLPLAPDSINAEKMSAEELHNHPSPPIQADDEPQAPQWSYRAPPAIQSQACADQPRSFRRLQRP